MKAGILSGKPADDEPYYPYWVAPDKPQIPDIKNWKGSINTTQWDQNATARQTLSIVGYLTNALGTEGWMERGHRFYFQKEEDWEMFKTMCLLGWQ